MSYPRFYNGSRVRYQDVTYRVIGISVDDAGVTTYNLGMIEDDEQTWTQHHSEVAEDALTPTDDEQLSRGPETGVPVTRVRMSKNSSMT